MSRTPAPRLALDARLLLRPGHAVGPLADHAVFGALLPDRLRGGPRAALRRHRRHLRGPPAGRARPAPRASRSPARSDDDRTLEPTAVPLTAVRIGDRADRDGPGRGDRRAGPAHARGRARRPSRGAGIGRVVLAGLRQRVRVLLHDARGVRRAALRGRHDRLRPGQRAVPDHVARRPGRPPGPRAAGARAATRSTRRGACARPRGPSRPARRAAERWRQPARRRARLGHAVFRWRGGASGHRPPARPRRS